MATRLNNACKHPRYYHYYEESQCQFCSVKSCSKRMAPHYGVSGEITGFTIGCIDFVPFKYHNQYSINFSEP